ncbi:hypothetical protein [Alicyclobacillus sp. SO9]|uniref:hypothetical protein n=1 Tax=Alicyclobacillus sp. SO9 TaxID=2665646 RepID=UPI0018E8C2DA|nr:hypothetical protein [Alicyclobacillus sp. SO9]QQE79332.1 hypothetical protein GI364_02135 [Alicyclobacillus sp. SO9]
MWGKGIIKKAVITAVAVGSLLVSAPIALADGGGSGSGYSGGGYGGYGGGSGDNNGGGSGDNHGGGSGSGTSGFKYASGYLTFYLSKQEKQSTQDLQWGHTYYVKINGKSGSGFGGYDFWVSHQSFYFYNYSQSKLSESPGKWGSNVFKSIGTKVSTGFYKVNIPAEGHYSSGKYIVQTHLSFGGKDYYFTCGPSNGFTHVTIHGNGTAGDMPEVPYAGILPAVVLLGAGYLYLRRRRKTTR